MRIASSPRKERRAIRIRSAALIDVQVAGFCFNLHSQTQITFHPNRRSLRRRLASLCRVAAIFASAKDPRYSSDSGFSAIMTMPEATIDE